jgi:A/G-specific adenine glycosylase
MDVFAQRLLAWFEQHGRRDLPWQIEPTPYRVWVSEIMLQQTQVKTVIPYFERFVARFPDVATLARASLDEVLHHWSGLGYYARARHLHTTAQRLLQGHGGEFPTSVAAIADLPGIGRSTAGAILAFARGERHPILDGNVKRVLTRYHRVEGWPGQPAVARRLWAYAERHTPTQRVREYTQAIMDLGAMICTRTRARCTDCPVAPDCKARRQDCVAAYPAARPRAALPVRQTTFIILRNARGEVLLEQRPPAGLWGGLWGFPECPAGAEPGAWCDEYLRLRTGTPERWPVMRHSFTHFHLDIAPVCLPVLAPAPGLMESAERLWYNNDQPALIGLAAPVSALLQRLPRQQGKLS